MIISSALISPSPTAALITCVDVKPLFFPPGFTSPFVAPGRKRSVCRVVVRSDGEASTSASLPAEEEEKAASAAAKIGAKIRVKVPLKVYHVPKIPEVDLTGMEGELKQYVGVWKGKRISANFPFKAQFVIQVEDKGPVKFFAHLREDEFDYI